MTGILVASCCLSATYFHHDSKRTDIVGALHTSNDRRFLKIYLRNTVNKTVRIYRPDRSLIVVSCNWCKLVSSSKRLVVEPIVGPHLVEEIVPGDCRLYLIPIKSLIHDKRFHLASLRLVNQESKMFTQHDDTITMLSASTCAPLKIMIRNQRVVRATQLRTTRVGWAH